MRTLVAIYLGVIGAIFGSFVCAMSYRIIGNTKSSRSHCLECNYQLRWFDMVPILSWVALKGKCRRCKKTIGWWELFLELGLCLLFVVSYLFWPKDIWDTISLTQFIVWLFLLIVLATNFITDMKWGILNTKVLILGIILGTVFFALELISIGPISAMNSDKLLDLFGSMVILPGLYFALYKLSDEKWVGGGDYLLCVPIALVLNNLISSLLVLTIANILAMFFIFPSYFTKRKNQIFFGPFLISAFLIVFFFKDLALNSLIL